VCSNENGHTEDVTGHVLDQVEEICRRKTIIIATSVSAVAVCIILIISLIIFRLQRKRARETRKRENVINMLRKGEGQYQFLAFLAFSSEDEEFVNTNLLNQLNENLQLMTGIDRNLVCTGDLNLRPGFYLHNETYLLLNKTCVIIAAVSKNFCHSVNCQNELEQAYVNGKPIILMFIEHVEQEQMSTTMKELYQRKVRIVWTLKNGENEMKTTWGNVCTSILELIK
jgi:succinyl-CoA synthetase alpha subunit